MFILSLCHLLVVLVLYFLNFNAAISEMGLIIHIKVLNVSKVPSLVTAGWQMVPREAL